MKLLTYPRTEYLLEASLGSLHTESQEWLNEIDFWRDEMAFFYKILHTKESKKAFPSKELAAVEKELVRINSEKLDKLCTAVANHERFLSLVLKSVSLQEEQNYRETHRKLLNDMFDLHVLIRSFKKDVFSFINKHEL